MRKAVLAVSVVILGAALPLTLSGQAKQSLPIKVSLRAYEEATVSIDNKNIERVNLILMNQQNQVSTVWWTSFFQGKERSETEIGPKAFRTFDLQPKVAEEGGAPGPDRKILVLDVGRTDAILIHVEKGEVLVHMSKDTPTIQ